MIVIVNAQHHEVDDQITVATLLESLGYPDRGIAVAVDRSVLPRAHWSTTLVELRGSTQPVEFEVVTAVQGG